MRFIFVRRGQFSTYKILVERCQLLEGVAVEWDRRLGEDRRLGRAAVPSERRAGDRRRPGSPDVDLRGYTVVDIPDKRDPPADPILH